jgi:hypothetical protein
MHLGVAQIGRYPVPEAGHRSKEMNGAPRPNLPLSRFNARERETPPQERG